MKLEKEILDAFFRFRDAAEEDRNASIRLERDLLQLRDDPSKSFETREQAVFAYSFLSSFVEKMQVYDETLLSTLEIAYFAANNVLITYEKALEEIYGKEQVMNIRKHIKKKLKLNVLGTLQGEN